MNSIPAEIRNSIKKNGFVMLIRGDPGTGKTTLALTMASVIDKTAYVSSKKIMDEIVRSYPWVTKKIGDRVYLLDKKYKFKNTEKFGNLFHLLPPVFRYLLNMFEEGKIKNIIIDSWYTLIEEMKLAQKEEEVRGELYDPEEFFLKIFKLSNLGVNFIIVKEGYEDSEIAYLADGIITLQKEMERGRIYRKMLIEKLRGIEVKKFEYLFTLAGGRFKFFISTPMRRGGVKIKYTGEKIEKGKEIPSVYFNKIFRFNRGDTVFYDFDVHVPMEYHVTTIMGLISNFLVNNSRVIFIPPYDVNINELKYHIYLFGIGDFYENLLFLYPMNILEEYAKKIDFSTANFEKIIGDELENHGKNVPLVVLGYDRLYNYMGGTAMKKLIIKVRDIVKEKRGVLLITGKISDEDMKRFISGISELHIKFKNIGDTTVMYGIKPWTNAHALELDMKRGYPHIRGEGIL